MEVSLEVWLLTIGLIALLFALDLGTALLRPREVGFREALLSSIFYITVALLFGLGVGIFAGWNWGTEFFAGYLLERSLSIDNLFVFVIILSVFAVPKQYQQKILLLGIFLALLLRVVFILLGATLLETFSFTFLIFGLLLLWTSFQLFRHRNEDPDINDNILLRTIRRRLPFTDSYGKGNFLSSEDGRRVFTPMLLVLVAIATTDILFALDSIPAIFGVTQEVYLVFAANAFALLGLRALFFLVTGLLDRLVYLSSGLAAILGLIGIKLSLHWAHGVWERVPEVNTFYSLLLIVLILILTTIASLWKVKKDPTLRAHAGSLRKREEEK